MTIKLLNRIGIREHAPNLIKDTSLRYCLFVFLLTRLIVFAIFVVTTNLSVIESHRDPNNGIPTYEAEVPLQRIQIGRKLREIAPHGDAGWYMGLAQTGYERVPFDASHEHSWAFFPMFPFVLRLAAKLTHEYQLTGMLLSTFLLLPALIFCHKTILASGFDVGVANRTVLYLAIFPMSYFFSLPMSESLYLLISAACLCAAARDRWWLAGAAGAIASATRNPGILLFPALIILYWQHYGFRYQRKLWAVLLVPVGLLAYMFFLHHITGNAFAAFQIQRAWGRHFSLNVVWPFWHYLTAPIMLAQPWYLVGFHFIAGVGGLVSGILLLKWRQWALGFYVLAGVLLPLASSSLGSMTRYVMILFPVFVPLAIVGRSGKIDQTIRAIFLVLLSLLTAMFAAHFSFAFT
jgi:hypothetical protein